MPSSRAARMMRTAISPRLAMRSFWIVIDARTVSNVNLGNRLAGHHGLLVLGEETQDLARRAGLDLVERFHHLDEPDRVVLRNGISVGLVVRLIGRGFAIEYAGQRREYL